MTADQQTRLQAIIDNLLANSPEKHYLGDANHVRVAALARETTGDASFTDAELFDRPASFYLRWIAALVA